jgi:dihydroxyacetone kinase-like predicted kinase
MVREIDGTMLKAMFKKATENLSKHKDEINALNVFPVPDGDTGSNMVATMMEGCEYLDRLENEDMESILKAMKEGTLMGARGNSGVILSQIISGFVDGYPKGKERINVRDFVEMMRKAKEVAYSAVMKPVEGTMLTVMRLIHERSPEVADVDNF